MESVTANILTLTQSAEGCESDSESSIVSTTASLSQREDPVTVSTTSTISTSSSPKDSKPVSATTAQTVNDEF